MRIIKAMEEKYLLPSLELVEAVFTAHSDAEEGKLVRSLVEEIRGKDDGSKSDLGAFFRNRMGKLDRVKSIDIAFHSGSIWLESEERLEQNEELSEKDAEIDRLKAEIAERDAEIDRLRRELEDAQAKAKSDTENEVLAMVETAGGIKWLKGVQSQGKVEPRTTDSTTMNKMQAKAEKEQLSFTEYRKRKAERNKKK